MPRDDFSKDAKSEIPLGRIDRVVILKRFRYLVDDRKTDRHHHHRCCSIGNPHRQKSCRDHKAKDNPFGIGADRGNDR